MCGIAGLFLRERARVDERVLAAMTDAIAHRGPDDRTLHVAGRVGLGYRRLSVIDPAGGRQPLFNEARDVTVIFNGELYNFRELRAELQQAGHAFRTGSDAEVLVHLYEEHGDHLLERLVGMFAFALLDARGGRERLLLARDPLGVKPLYYAESERGLFFGSEAKAVLASGELARELRPQALLDYLVQGYVGGTEAAWSGMQRLRPGHLLVAEDGRVQSVRRYWDMPRQLRGPSQPDEILEWLDRCVKDQLVSDVPLGAFLSGGIDSTAVATSMRRADAGPLVLCSVGFRERSHDELPIAQRTAARLGAVHHTRVLEPDPALALDTLPWFFDEPLADPSTVPTYLVSKVAREHVTVALSGDGGDETFGGYRRYVHDVAENRVRSALGSPGRAAARTLGRVYPRLDWAPRALRGRTFLTNVGDEPARAYWRSVTRIERAEAVALLHPDLAARLAEHDPFAEFARHYRVPEVDDPLYRAQYADFHTYLPDQILAKADRASMAVSLEVRVPLLDHRFVERFANLPANEKVRNGRGKHALREALRSRLPAEVLDGAKRGFDTPLGEWIRGPLREPVRAALEELPGDWFVRSTLHNLLAEHLGGARNHDRLLWSLLVLERWRERHAVTGLSA
ncbi:MAG: asparagine synthase (glutamine-hydrolyzing) [Planctomycetes bacterium]|nr:asparagine synthase (glutamine-hydrolyzing) [Planctomycetota bacterium]